MRTPSQTEMTAYFQGYQQREIETQKAIREARRGKKSTVQAIRDSYMRNLRLWQMRAETKGYDVMPKSDQVVAACVLVMAFVAVFALWCFT